MIDRLVVQLTNSNQVEKELSYLSNHYSYKKSFLNNDTRELVFQTYTGKVLFYKSWSNCYKTWNTSICLPSFKDIPRLHLLQSIGLSDKEIQEYFPWRTDE